MASPYDDKFRMFYICQAGGQWRRMTATSYKSYPLATNQRWYCVVCGGRYKVGFGILIEVKHKDITYFIRASVLDGNVLDVLALSDERRLVEELFNILPVLRPSTDFLQPVVGHEDCFKTGAAKYDNLPSFNCSDLLAVACKGSQG